VLALCDKVVAASSSIYHTISKELLPTPAKPHYTFNLRDLGKVFQVRWAVCGHPPPTQHPPLHPTAANGFTSVGMPVHPG
jgi:hypothetical protein